MHEALVSFESALGLLLLAFAAESARRDETDGTLWPCVRRRSDGRLRFSYADSVLFDANEQPRTAFRKAIESAARVFGLRHVFDEEDVDRYYLTVFVQFGFSLLDARKQLSLWLSSTPRQEGIRRLREGRLRSRSFNRLWHQLRLARPRSKWLGLDVNELRLFLDESPWVLPEWADDLIKASLSRTIGTVEDDREMMSTSAVKLLSRPAFRWNLPGPPCFSTRVINLTKLRLNEAAYELWVGGERVVEIVENEEGIYCATSEDEIVLHGLPTTVSAELRNVDDEVIWADVLDCLDPTPLITIYRLPGGVKVDESAALQPTGNYALIAADDFEVHPAVEFRRLPASRLCTYLLTPETLPRTRVSADGLPVWIPALPGRPRPAESDAAKSVSARITPAMIGPWTDLPCLNLQVYHPSRLQVVRTRILGRSFTPRPGPGVTTFGPFRLPVERLVYSKDQYDPPGILELVIQVEDEDGNSELVRKRATYNGHGAAIRRGEVWDDLPTDGLPRITKEEADSHPFYIVPRCKRAHPRKPNVWVYLNSRDWIIRELDRRVTDLEARPQIIGGLYGYGAPLSVRHRSTQEPDDMSLTLARSVIDRGWVREVVWPELNEDGKRVVRLNMNHGVEIEKGRYQVLWWDHSGTLRWLDPFHDSPDGELPRHDWWFVTLPSWAGNCRALGIAYEGRRVGAWWAEDWFIGLNEIDAIGAGQVALLIRWLKLPVLDRNARPYVDQFLESAFGEVAGVWVFPNEPQEPFRYDTDITGWRDAVACLYRDCAVTKERALQLSELAWQVSTPDRGWPALASYLDEIHPFFLFHVVRFLVGETPSSQSETSALFHILLSRLCELSSNDKNGTKSNDLPAALVGAAKSLATDPDGDDSEFRRDVDAVLTDRPVLRRRLSCECLKQYKNRLGIR